MKIPKTIVLFSIFVILTFSVRASAQGTATVKTVKDYADYIAVASAALYHYADTWDYTETQNGVKSFILTICQVQNVGKQNVGVKQNGKMWGSGLEISVYRS
jgi:hypothetical protein